LQNAREANEKNFQNRDFSILRAARLSGSWRNIGRQLPRVGFVLRGPLASFCQLDWINLQINPF
jgi:hypothetical protein